MNKKRTCTIGLVLFAIVVLIQSIYLGSANEGNVPFWLFPSRYLSIWITDLYLVGLFFFNYFLLAPLFVRQRSWVAYLLSVALSVLLGMFLPILLAQLCEWGTPQEEPQRVGLSALGSLGALSVLAVGLAIRSLREWILQGEKNQALEAENKTLRNELQSLKSEKATPSPTLQDSISHTSAPSGL